MIFLPFLPSSQQKYVLAFMIFILFLWSDHNGIFYHFIDEIKPRRKYFWVSVRPIIAEYLEVTTIHGLRYLMECRNLMEKLFWLLIICLSFGYAAHTIQSFFVDNDREPILTTIGTSRVQEVPFPAITIRHSLHQI